MRSIAFCSSISDPSYCALTIWSCSSISSCSTTIDFSRAMYCTASLVRSSRSTAGEATFLYFSKPSFEIIFWISASGVPCERMSASMTANFCRAASVTMASGIAVSAHRSARTVSILVFTTCCAASPPLGGPPCFCCCCCCAAVTVSSMRLSRASTVVLSAAASVGTSGISRRWTFVTVTSNTHVLPASDGSRGSCAGNVTGTSTTLPLEDPRTASTTPGRNFPGASTSGKFSPPTARSNLAPLVGVVAESPSAKMAS
mmetsp:Transcript_21811/g.86580  ORF Transcript_21811/g.86580 Transcript_21811/m.86580 type:complete len:258 (+) Transcript_21811:473-1246(+)